MADELVDEYVDRSKFASDTAFIKEQMAEVIELYNKVKGTKINIQAGTSLKQISEEAQLGVKSNAQLVQSTKAVVDVVNQRFASEAKLKTIQTDYFRETQKNKLITADFVKELKLQAQVDLAQSGSIQKATALRAKMYFEQTRLNLATKEGADRNELLKGRIDSLSNFIKKNSDALTAQKINIGNYGGAVQSTMTIIQQEIDKINDRIAKSTKNSDGFNVLTRQALLLQSVQSSLGETFGTTSAELKALQEAAKKVGTEFGVSSNIFIKFAKEVGERKDAIADIQNAIKFKSSDTKGLDTIVQGLQAITGAYGAYEAVTALVGAENEDLAKSMQKIQAVLTLVTSVQAVANALQSESALIQGGLAVKAALWAAAQRLAAIATGQTTVALVSETAAAVPAAAAVTGLATAQSVAAASANAMAVANLSATGALSGATLSAGTLSTTLGGVAVAEGAVATGATTMATAIAATGIGLLLIGIATAVYFIVDALIDWNKENKSVESANEDLAASVKALIEATKAYDDLARESTNRQLDDFDKLIAKRKALGVTTLQGMALDKEAAGKRFEAAAREVGLNDITEESVSAKALRAKSQSSFLVELEQRKLDFINKTRKAGNANYEDEIEAYDKSIKKQKDKVDAATADYQRDFEIYKTYTDAKQNLDIIYAQEAKQRADEAREYQIESARIRAELQKSLNDQILNDEKSTLDQRVAALRNNLIQQKAVINAENNAIQSDPTVSGTVKATAQAKANADILIATRENEQALAELREDFRLRDLDAITDMQKRVLDVIVKTNEAILNNEALTEQQRLEALQNAIQARTELINAGFEQQLSEAGISDANIERIKAEGFFEIENKKLTNEELKNLISEYNADVLELAKESNEQRIAIVKDYYQLEADARDKALRDIQRANDLLTEDVTDTGNNQIIALNDQLKRQEINQQQYNERRVKMEADTQRRLLLLQIDQVEKSLAATVSAKETEKRLQDELNALKTFTGPQTDDEKKVNADRIKVLTDELTKIQEVIGKETELYKQLSKLKKDLSDADTKTFTDNQQKILDGLNKFKNAMTEVFGVITGALNAVATAQKNRLADQSNAIDQETAKEIERINATQQAEETKAAQIIIVNARAQAQKEQIAQRQRKIDQEQARAQKLFAIFQIALNTAIAITKVLGNPFQVALVAALGAAQLAIAIATPIPKFKHGKGAGNNYQGPAIVDDGGRNEPILRADGTVEMSTGPARDRLTWVDRHDIVYPSLDAMLNYFSKPKVGSPRGPKNDGAGEMIRIMGKQNVLLEKIAGKKELHQSATDKGMSNIWRWGSNRIKYIDENTNW